MTLLAVQAFNGLKPISTPRLLGQNEAQVAENVRLVSGALVPLRQTTTLKTTSLAAPKTIFRYGSSAEENQYWLEFAQDTDVMRSPVANDQYDRLYWTDGDNVPRYAPNSMILSSQPYPGASFPLGIPQPSTAITASGTPVPVYNTVTREYVATFYDPTAGKESQPTTVFTAKAVDGFPVSLSNLTTNNRGDAGVTKKRLYRKLSGTFRLVVELDLSATTYEDTMTDSTLAGQPALAAAVGIQSTPTRAPSVTLTGAVTSESATAREYVYTVVSVAGPDGSYYAESAPSNAVAISVDNTQTVTISGLSTSGITALGGAKFRIYRKDSTSSQYLYLAEFATSQTSYADKISDTTLGWPIAYDAPTTVKPTTTPTVSANGSTAAPAVKHVYMVTFADADGNESARGPASSVVNVVDGITIATVTHSETIPAGVVTKKLYRQTVTVSGSTINIDEANWKLVSSTSSGTTSFSDQQPDSALTTPFPTALQNIPPTPSGSPSLAGEIPAKVVPESRTYVYTYVSQYGEEGPPSEASEVIEIDPSIVVNLTVPGGAPAANIALKRIYRSSTVGSRAVFQFVAEIPVAQTAYADSVQQANLGENLPSDGWLSPPAGLKGLRLMANGAAVGFVGKTLWLSEPNLPHAWPHQYTLDEEIVAIGTYGQTVAVTTKSYPYLFQGIDPAAMAQTKLALPQACVSKRSLVETGDGILYASPDGLVSIGNGVNVVTSPLYSRDQWQALNPSSMQTFLYNGRALVFYTKANNSRGVLMFDLTGQGAVLTTSNVGADNAVNAGYYDARLDKLYLAKLIFGTPSIARFDDGSNLSFTWRSKVFRLPYQQNLGFAQVRADAFPLTMKIYVDGVLKHTQTVASDREFRLPSGFRGLDWEFQLEGSSTVTEVFLASSAMELKAA